jgi:DNA-binding NtrC family response regulator
MMRAHQGMLGGSPAILDVIAEARYVASRDAKVLITGESGVGKELLARFIHENSRRRVKPMASINCAAVTETDAHAGSEGLFDVANGGTIFLDEIGEMGARMQALLLRVLENDADMRIISATSRDLLQQPKDNAFRLDLYYRLNVVHLVIPPLRERREDIRPLFDHFVRLCQEPGAGPITVSEDVYPCLEAYNWPFNIRELRNVAERTMGRDDGVFRVEDLPVDILREAAFPHGYRRRSPPRRAAGREGPRLVSSFTSSTARTQPPRATAPWPV